MSLKLWDTKSSNLNIIETLKDYIYFPLSLDIDSTDKYILTASKGFDGVGCELKLWDLRQMKVIYTMTGHTQDTTCCCIININNKMIGCSCSKDESIKSWDLNSGNIISDIRQNSSIFLSLSYRKNSIYFIIIIIILIDEHNKVYIYATTSSGEYGFYFFYFK